MKDLQLQTQEKEKVLFARAVEIRNALAKTLRELGHKVKLTDAHRWSSGITYIDDCPIELLVKMQQAGYGFRFYATGKLYIVFGRYGNRKTYPEPKAGFDLEKLVGLIEAWIDKENKAQEAVNARVALEDKRERELKALKARYRIPEGYTPNLELIVARHGFRATIQFDNIAGVEELLKRWYNPTGRGD